MNQRNLAIVYRKELLDLLRSRYDTIVFDTPPMVNIADARLVGRYADGVVMVVRSMYTTRDAALLAPPRRSRPLRRRSRQ